MRTTLALALALLAAGPGVAGCLTDAGEAIGGCGPFVEVSMFHPGGVGDPVVPRGGEASVPLVLWLENTAGTTVDVEIDVTGLVAIHLGANQFEPSDADAEVELEEGNRTLVAFRLLGPVQDRRVLVEMDTHARGTEADLRNPLCGDSRTQRWDLVTDVRPVDERVEPGKGALVRTVGWWTNGTSFYTNLQRFHDRGDLPRSYLGPYEGDDPLKVYVYNDSADEMPERYNESGYATTIPGFNAALKDLPTVGGRVTYLEPAQAYTRDGYEDHPLYGDPLVFYIEAVEVRTVPCEVPQPVCTPPDGDDAPPDPFGLAPTPRSPGS